MILISNFSNKKDIIYPKIIMDEEYHAF